MIYCAREARGSMVLNIEWVHAICLEKLWETAIGFNGGKKRNSLRGLKAEQTAPDSTVYLRYDVQKV